MKGKLSSLYRAKLVKGPSGACREVLGSLGVFDYDGAHEGNICLFAPDEPEALGGRVKLRPGPGAAQLEGDALRFRVKVDGRSYTWQIIDVITDPSETRAFISMAESSDRIIRHLLEGARLVGE